MATDLELLDHWRAGDQKAGSKLFERYFTSISRFFENKLDRDVEELVQATFMACLDQRDKFRGQSSFRTYIFAIARYQLYGYFRRNQRAGDVLDFGVTSLADLGASARGIMARNQEHQQLLAALVALPIEQQLLLELHYWEDMKTAELAEIFDVEPTTIRTRLFRARQALGTQLAQLAESGGAETIHTSLDDLDAWARRLQSKKPNSA